MTRSERYFKKGFSKRKQYKKSSRKEERMAMKSVARSSNLESYYNDDSLLSPLKSHSAGMMREEWECCIPTKFLNKKIKNVEKDGQGRCYYKPVKGGVLIS